MQQKVHISLHRKIYKQMKKYVTVIKSGKDVHGTDGELCVQVIPFTA